MADWFYAQGTTQRGPVAVQFILDSLRTGALNAEDLVWRDGIAQWTPAGQVPELASAFAPTPPPPLQAQPAAYGVAATPPSMASVYGQPYLPAAPSQHSGLAITSMVLGILGMCCASILTGVPALITGVIALNGMKRTGDSRGRGMAIAGVVLGSISIAIAIAWVGLFFAVSAVPNRPMVFPTSPQTPHTWKINP